MLNQLENYYWRYNSASQLVNTILKFVDPRAQKLFQRSEFLSLSESMFTTMLSRPTMTVNESRKFQVMLLWAMNKIKVKNCKNNSTSEFAIPENLSKTKAFELQGESLK